MFTEKEEEQLNKFFRTHTFDYYGPVMSDTFRVTLYYKLKLKGTRKMISVGEYYDYLDVLVEIIDADEKSTTLLAVFKLLKNNIDQDYILKSRLDKALSDELSYFFNGTYVRVKIVKVQIGEELQEKIDSVDLEAKGSINEGVISNIKDFVKKLFSGNKEKTNQFFSSLNKKQKNKKLSSDNKSIPENIVIGDSQAPYVANGSNKFELISTEGSEKSLWLGGKTLSWLLDAVKKHNGSENVKNIAICIGTNGAFNTNDNIKGLIDEVEKKFPNAELFVIQGSWGWGGLKNIKETKVRDYYKLFKDYGVEVIEPPIGKIEPHGNKPIYKEIGKNLDSKV